MNMSIGRYQLQRELGQGAEGRVWLAYDPLLDREVAIKTIIPRAGCQPQRLLTEARLVSRIHHHHVVPLFDALEDNDTLALVFEYVEGESLAQRIAREGALACEQAVEYAIQLLDGLSVAHDMRILHRDIKPSNILIDQYGTARITDFGVAVRLDECMPETAGSHAFVAPEFLRGESAGVNADVFSLGMVLYTMLVGRVPIQGETIYEVWYQLVHGKLHAPSKINPAIDERLDDIVLKALFQQQNERFSCALDMRRALYDWLTLGEGAALGELQATPTLDFLLRRMRLNCDFPVLSQSIVSINRIQHNETQSIHALANTVLKDFALTNKLLRLVNSACYSQFSGKVSTISRAAMILGVNAIRNLAMSIMLIDHLQNRSQAQYLRENIMASFMIGQFAKKLAHHLQYADIEEVFVCGVFQRLGQLLSIYYFYDESLVIRRRLYAGESEQAASQAVLGISYQALARAIAKTWSLPEQILASLSPIEGPLKPPKTAQARLQYIVTLAAQLFDAVNANTSQERHKQLNRLADEYGHIFGLDYKRMLVLVETAVGEMLVEAPYFGLKLQKGDLLRFIHVAMDADAQAESTALEGVMPEAADIDSTIQPRQASRLSAGLQDLSMSLMDKPSPHVLSRLLLETMYSGATFDRVILFFRDPAALRLVARHAQGAQMEHWAGSLLIPLDKADTPINRCFATRERLYCPDTRSLPLPDWFSAQFTAASFVLLPVYMGDKLIAALYGDALRPGQLNLSDNVLNMLDTLRNLFVLGLSQYRPADK